MAFCHGLPLSVPRRSRLLSIRCCATRPEVPRDSSSDQPSASQSASPSRRLFLARILSAALLVNAPSVAEETKNSVQNGANTSKIGSSGAELSAPPASRPNPPKSPKPLKNSVPKWSYTEPTGPSSWGQLSPEYSLASSGQMQSPIPISYRSSITNRTISRPLLTSNPSTFTFRLRDFPTAANPSLVLEQYLPPPPPVYGDVPPLDLPNPPPPPASITYDSATYVFRSVQFHAGATEHTIDNVSGAAEIQFVFERRPRQKPPPPPPSPSKQPNTSNSSPTTEAPSKTPTQSQAPKPPTDLQSSKTPSASQFPKSSPNTQSSETPSESPSSPSKPPSETQSSKTSPEPQSSKVSKEPSSTQTSFQSSKELLDSSTSQASQQLSNNIGASQVFNDSTASPDANTSVDFTLNNASSTSRPRLSFLSPPPAVAAETSSNTTTKPHTLIVSVLARRGFESTSWLANLLSEFTKKAGADGRYAVLYKDLNISTMLKDFKTSDLYVYSGSLTTPPCTEGVLWAVMRSRCKISVNDTKTILRWQNGRNVRPLQDINSRTIIRFPPAQFGDDEKSPPRGESKTPATKSK